MQGKRGVIVGGVSRTLWGGVDKRGSLAGISGGVVGVWPLGGEVVVEETAEDCANTGAADGGGGCKAVVVEEVVTVVLARVGGDVSGVGGAKRQMGVSARAEGVSRLRGVFRLRGVAWLRGVATSPAT